MPALTLATMALGVLAGRHCTLSDYENHQRRFDSDGERSSSAGARC